MKNYLIILLLLTSCVKQEQKKIILNKQELTKLQEIRKSDQKYRKFDGAIPKNKIDSLVKNQNEIDIKNSDYLMELIGKYGYLKTDNSNINTPIFILLTHTPEKNKAKLHYILDDELKQGNIEKQTYTLLISHLGK